MISLAAATIIAGIAAAAGGVTSAILNKTSTDKANEDNLKFANKQFGYQQYLNQNQYGIQASDAERAGLNPMTLHGVSLQSTSMSAGQQSADFSGISDAGNAVSSAISSAMQVQAQKYVADKQAETQVKVAETHEKAETARNTARIKAQEIIAARNASLTDQQNKLREIEINNDKGYKDALVSIQRAKQEFDNYYNDEQIKIKKQELEQLEKQLETAKKNADTYRISTIWRRINETINTGFNIIKGIVSPFSGGSNPIGFSIE